MGETRHETCFLIGEVSRRRNMSVSTRNTFAAVTAGLAFAGLAFAGGGMSGSGGNSCNSGCGPKGHNVVVPGATVGTPTVSQGGIKGMGKGQQVFVPGVNVAGGNVHVGSPTISVGGAGVAFGATSFVDTGLNVQVEERFDNRQFIGTGGYVDSPDPVAPSAISGLYVDGNVESYTDTVTEQVPTTQTSCVQQSGYTMAYKPVQAVCVDDKGTPHPASRPSSDQRVDSNFEGEIFRCMAGTTMQVIIGDDTGLAGGRTATSFNNASGFSCAKGQALVHRRGGQLVCQAQIPQRNCNERSLLRRNGPGIKLVKTKAPAACVPTTTTVMQSVTRQVQKTRPAKTGPMVFDGGVGQSVY